jgi:hypothetical protein
VSTHFFYRLSILTLSAAVWFSQRSPVSGSGVSTWREYRLRGERHREDPATPVRNSVVDVRMTWTSHGGKAQQQEFPAYSDPDCAP